MADQIVDAALESWLAEHIPDLRLPITSELVAGGRSNLTFRLRDSMGKSYAMRMPPAGDIPAGAHDMSREWGWLTALGPTRVRVPRPLAFCTDRDVASRDLYVMEFVDGTVLADRASADNLDIDARHTASEQTIDMLAELHTIEPGPLGLFDGRPADGFLLRQLRRWSRQISAMTFPEKDLLDEVGRRLAADIPDQTTGIVHGDYRPGNLVYAPDGHVLGILDWELAAIGDVLVDLGWLLASWELPNEDFTPITEGPTAADGFLSRDDLASRYAATTGHDLERLDYYLAFARWRIGCIGVGVRHRYLSGAMGDDGYDATELNTHIGVMGESALESLL